MKKYVLILFTLLELSSCGKFLEEYSQDLYYAHRWEDLDELLVGSAYLPHEASYTLKDVGTDISHYGQFLHMLTDEIEEVKTTDYSSQDFDIQEMVFGAYTWQQRIGTTDTYTGYNVENTTWTKSYYHINVCNNILASLDKLNIENEEDEQGHHKVKGEAHFIRAFIYFFLNNLYGKPYDPATAKTDLGVPIKLNENVEDVKYQRNTVQEVYEQVLADLEIARTELAAYKGARKSIYRADYTSAVLLSARVALYMQDWKNASKYAQEVIRLHPVLEDLNGTTAPFDRADNPEEIFSMAGNDNYGIYSNGYKGFQMSRDFYDTYSSDDLRKSRWFWSHGTNVGLCRVEPRANWSSLYEPTSPSFYFLNIHSSYNGVRIGVSNICRLRSAEAYMIEAEAQAYMGNEDAARKAVNTIRAKRYKAGSKTTDITSSGDLLITDIRAERRRELVGDGQRWFDLRRYLVCEKMPESHAIIHDYTYYVERNSMEKKECHRFVLQPFDKAYTLGIPHEVLQFNTGMQDNERYYREYEIVPLD